MTRLELQSTLEELLGSGNVYYKPPGKEKLVFPAILYDKSGYEVKHADNGLYVDCVSYKITVMATAPDHPVINKIRKLPRTSYDRCYKSDNVYHDVIKIII